MPFLGQQPVEGYKTTAKQTITGDGSTSYTLNNAVTSGTDLEVFVNNVRQEPGTDYSASGNTITFTTAVESSDSCWLVYQGKAVTTTSIESDNLADGAVTSAKLDQTYVNFDSSGNVGIGTSSPSGKLDVVGDIKSSGEYVINSGTTAKWTLGQSSDSLYFYSVASGSERMRIDTSGNLLVAKTSTNSATAGVQMESTGTTVIGRDGAQCLILNRLTSDGDIVQFRRDGTTRGALSIWTKDSVPRLVIGSGNTGLLLNDSINSIHPVNAINGANRDNTVDVGSSTNRFDDVYATNGTIQTSDQNEKQQIASLTDAEMNVAKRLSALFKTFKWNSAVEEKGDNARTHSGIIAQDMQQAFTDEGLDAGNYAMFISDTWWEKEISVDAVEEETDEEGNVITEGQDAYTYMDSKYEATEGYTEKTRLGVRYPELFAFINAYNDQRFEALETRIEALENA